MTPTAPLVSADWLARHLDDQAIAVLDGRWYLPNQGHDTAAEYTAGHIAGAPWFDIDAIADGVNPLPHMLPDGAQFAKQVERLGIGDESHVIAYDSGSGMAAARIWWMMRVFGHDRVSVLDGGLKAWATAGQTLVAGPVTPPSRNFTPRFRPALVRDRAAMLANCRDRRAQVADARSAGRYYGVAPEPRPGLRGGHMPGSRALPFNTLMAEDGCFLPGDKIAARFADSGIDLARPLITTCGTGVTAAVLALGAAIAGQTDVAVYDGSWAEWGASDDTPIVLVTG